MQPSTRLLANRECRVELAQTLSAIQRAAPIGKRGELGACGLRIDKRLSMLGQPAGTRHAKRVGGGSGLRSDSSRSRMHSILGSGDAGHYVAVCIVPNPHRHKGD